MSVSVNRTITLHGNSRGNYIQITRNSGGEIYIEAYDEGDDRNRVESKTINLTVSQADWNEFVAEADK